MTNVRDKGSLSNSDQTQLLLRWNNVECPIDHLDKFTFSVNAPKLASAHSDASSQAVYEGELCGLDETIEVMFRVRNIDNNQVLGGFFDLPISTRERLAKLAERAASPETDALQSLSYDELALGNTQKNQERGPQHLKKSSTVNKAIVSMVLAAAMIFIAGWVLMVVRSQSTISVSNSVMVGNYQPVNTPLEGKLLDLNVTIGDRVEAGQVLATIENPAVEHELKVIEAKISRAQQDLETYHSQSIEIKAMLKIAEQSLQKRRLVAEAERSRIRWELQAAQSHFKRLKKLQRKGFGRIDDYEQARALANSLVAQKKSQDAVIGDIAVSEKAVAAGVLVSDARVTNPMSDVLTKIALAKSLVAELKETRDLVATKAKPAELIAPSVGTVFAVYRRPGEVLKHADEVIAISRDGISWATGHIPSASAANIKPGQSVEIEIPSYGATAKGVIEGIGHRAVYGRGGYTADFRGGPLDVPVRVAINETSKPIPSGLRLNMTIRVRDRLKELHNWMDSWSQIATRKDHDPSLAPETTEVEPARPEPTKNNATKPDVKKTKLTPSGITKTLPKKAKTATIIIPDKKPDLTSTPQPTSQLDLFPSMLGTRTIQR